MKKSISKKTILKEAGILLIAAAMIFSAFAVSAESNKPTLSSKAKIASNMIKSNLINRGNVVWDNGPPGAVPNLYSSQNAANYPFISQVADDFQLPEDTIITDVHWWGGFWNGGIVNPCDFNIYIYADDGSGNKPTGGNPDPSPTALATYVFTGLVGVAYPPITQGFEYDVMLDPSFPAVAGQKYWIAIQGVTGYPPQYGWANADGIQLHSAVFGFPLLGYNFWTNVDPALDMAFYLTGPHVPVPDLDCEGSLSWTHAAPGATVTGTFKVLNMGEPGSLLNWKVTSWPEWGAWSFAPSSGTGLAEGDSVTVTATCISPKLPLVLQVLQNHEYTGNIVVTNSEDPADTDTVPVTLVTPINQPGIHGNNQQSQNHLIVRALIQYLNVNKLLHIN
jgi:hypothetical protein